MMKYIDCYSSLVETKILRQAWVGVFGLIAAVASFRTGWKATALPQPEIISDAPESSIPASSGYDVST
jgi:hypothetical protein